MTVHRLRPTVFATPLPSGVHVRGWASSFTVEGGPGLWRVWSALAGQLAAGVPGDRAVAPDGLAPAVRRAVDELLGQLREHDLLVEVPADWGVADGPGLPPPATARWLEAVAADPVAAWSRLRAVTVSVPGDGPVAEAARQAVRALGVTPDRRTDSNPTAGDRLSAGDRVVAAVCGAETAFVTPVRGAERIPAMVAGLTGRLNLTPAADPAPALVALAGSAAAHRLVAAVAGLPDPGEGPHVLIARLDPLRATYHPWLGDPPPVEPAEAQPTSAQPAERGLEAALLGLDALADPELGLIPPPGPADLPQAPAALALAGDVPGAGVTGDAARLDAALRALERLLGPGATAGAGPGHATGVALRRAIHAAALPGTEVAEADWATSPAVRRWWKALTLRCGVDARLRVRRLAPAVAHAEIVADGTVLAWAVEATPADAAALAALAATGIAQARAAGVPAAPGDILLTGAAPAWRPVADDPGGWSIPDADWPDRLTGTEDALQRAMSGLVSLRDRPAPGALADAVRRGGFEVLS